MQKGKEIIEREKEKEINNLIQNQEVFQLNDTLTGLEINMGSAYHSATELAGEVLGIYDYLMERRKTYERKHLGY